MFKEKNCKQWNSSFNFQGTMRNCPVQNQTLIQTCGHLYFLMKLFLQIRQPHTNWDKYDILVVPKISFKH